MHVSTATVQPPIRGLLPLIRALDIKLVRSDDGNPIPEVWRAAGATGIEVEHLANVLTGHHCPTAHELAMLAVYRYGVTVVGELWLDAALHARCARCGESHSVEVPK